MRDKETVNRIRKRLENAFDGMRCIAPNGDTLIINTPEIIAQCRRAKLLVRNEKFLEERREILEERAMELRSLEEACKKSTRMSAAQRRKNYVPSPEELTRLKPGVVLHKIKMPWQDFCYRWGISDSWSGELDGLDSWAIGEAEIFFREPSGKSDSVPLGGASASKKQLSSLHQARGERWADFVAGESSFIYLKISPATHREDLEKFWPLIEDLKKRIWGFSERAKQTFERDLCLWDLKNKPEEYGKMSYGDIMQKWNSVAPAGKKVKNTDLVKKAVKSIEDYINRMTPPRRLITVSIVQINPKRKLPACVTGRIKRLFKIPITYLLLTRYS